MNSAMEESVKGYSKPESTLYNHSGYDIYHIEHSQARTIMYITLHNEYGMIELVKEVLVRDKDQGDRIFEIFRRSAMFEHQLTIDLEEIIISREVDEYKGGSMNDISTLALQYIGYVLINGIDAINTMIERTGLTARKLHERKVDYMKKVPDVQYKLCNHILTTLKYDVAQVRNAIFKDVGGSKYQLGTNKCKIMIPNDRYVIVPPMGPPPKMSFDIVLDYYGIRDALGDDDILMWP